MLNSWLICICMLSLPVFSTEASKIVDTLIELAATDDSYPTPKELCGREDVTAEIIKRYDQQDPNAKLQLMSYISWTEREPDALDGRWIFSKQATALWVHILLDENNKRVVAHAESLLRDHVPDAYIRAHAVVLVEAARKDIQRVNIHILGKTGSEDARKLLETNPKYREISAQSTDIALAKLGRADLVTRFIKAFENEKDLREKAQLAETLGYIGDAACVNALVKEFRNVNVYTKGAVITPFRQEVAGALSMVYPECKEFWFRYYSSPEQPHFYENAEKWLTEKLGVKWDGPAKEEPGAYPIPHLPVKRE